MGKRGTAAVQHRGLIQRNHPIPELVAALFRGGMEISGSGVVYENVDAAKGCYYPVNGGVAVFGFCNVSGDGQAFCAQRLELCGNLIQLFPAPGENRNLGPMLCKYPGGFRANAGASTGNQGHFIR